MFLIEPRLCYCDRLLGGGHEAAHAEYVRVVDRPARTSRSLILDGGSGHTLQRNIKIVIVVLAMA